ncbi:unnamed protein product [Polarella glacialis]|uniref:Endonuclease/exonuclease/phosphatase domain-containing protein n=1 Tax=Polarella glacialis TaxID=89957 RepID=A0A813HP25_POLGL|nr:unnamed protein product [Polarella glacialis]
MAVFSAGMNNRAKRLLALTALLTTSLTGNQQHTYTPQVHRRFFSYNVFAATNDQRLRDICEVLPGDVLCLQGTQRRQVGAGLYAWSHKPSHLHQVTVADLGQYAAWHWGYGVGAHTNRATGVSILLRKKTFPPQWVSEVFSPPESLQGRAGGLRLKHKTIDITAFTLYAPNEPRTQAERRHTEAFYSWLYATVAGLPARTLVLLFGDMNGHVGSFSDEKGDFSGAIGKYQPQAENFNGAMMRKFLACLGLQAENTKRQTAAGPTYWAPTGQGSRVDYAMIPKEAAQRVRKLEIWRHAARQLQLFRTAKLRDHSPLMLTVRLGSHFSEHREPQTQWNYDTLRQNTHSKEIISKQRDFVQDINNALLQPDTAACAQASVATANPDKLWELIKSVVTNSAKNHFTCQNFSSKQIHDSPKTAQLRQQANTQFNQLRDLPTIPLSDWITGKIATTDFLHSAFQAWRAVTQLRSKDKQLHHAVKQDRDRHFQQISKDPSQAADSNDTHRVWKLARQLARTGLGPRLRQFGITACFPSIEEWISYLARPGRLGGCAATSATDIPLWIPPGPLNNNITVPTTTAQAEIDLDYMAIKFKQSRPYRVVPPWSAPAEVWRFIFGTDAHQQGLWQLRLLIFKLLQIIRTTGHSPYMWHHSLAKYIDKPNNKTGPAHYRVIHLLEPFSKCYHAALWEQGRHKEWSFAHGSFRHRRREAAIQQHLLLLWRLNACHLPHAALYLDVINAFPSVNRSVIDRVISLQFKEPEARLMRNHYEDARTTVTGQSAEQATLNINSGTMQGDSIGGHLFNQAFCPAVQHARKHLQLLGLTEPFALRDWLSDEPVDVATTVFADDVAAVTLFPDPEQAEQTVNAVFDTFATSLAKIGMALHEDFPVVPNFHGRGSQTLMQKAITAKHPVGNWCLSARYLGAQIKLSGGEVQEINARINAANICWYALSGFWFAAEIKVQYKLRVFRANILSVLTAGLEAWVLPLSQIHRLESWRMQKLRIILQGKGTFQALDNNNNAIYRAIPDAELRKRYKQATIQSELCVRRLSWLRTRIMFPSSWIALRALICQPLSFETQQQLDRHGQPTDNASPWLKQIKTDCDQLHKVAPSFPGVEALPRGIWSLLAHDSCLPRYRSKFKKVKSYHVPPPPDQQHNTTREDESMLLTCTLCEYQAASNKALATHRRRAHNLSRGVALRVITNQCPFCFAVFSTVAAALAHVRKRKGNNCPTRHGNKLSGLTALQVPKEICCKVCDQDLSTLPSYNKHLAQCIYRYPHNTRDDDGRTTSQEETSSEPDRR